MKEEAIERLLYENEGDYLDFKRDQYPLTTKDEKGELIKDILAFANAWRRVDAFILIGVDETKVAGKSTPVGISIHLSDSNLQQLVNSKTSTPIFFSYEAVSFKGYDLGVIRIAVQERPTFLTRDFGKLKKDVVYVRRGSSTDTAGLDEIFKMKAGATTPDLRILFADIEERRSLGSTLTLVSEIVDYDETSIPVIASQAWDAGQIGVNSQYKREMAAYIAKTTILNSVGFSLLNSASTLATNVRLVLTGKSIEKLEICDLDDYPTKPTYRTFYAGYFPHIMKNDVRVDIHGGDWHLTVDFGNVQPGAVVWSTGQFYVGALEAMTVDFIGFLYADNLPSPVPVSLTAKIDTIRRNISLNELEPNES